MFLSIERYTGEPRKWQKAFIILILALAILFTSFFNYVGWNSIYGGWLKNGIAIIFFAYLIIKWPKGNSYNFKVEILLLILLPFLSMLNTYSLYGQSYIESARVLAGNFVWVFYFMLHRYKVQESTILKAFIIIAIFIVGIEVIQQFTYPNAVFGIANEDTMFENGLQEMAEQRNGLWRFRISNGYFFTATVLFATMYWTRKKVNSKFLVVIALMLIGLYLTLTRQVIAATLLTIFLSFFLGKKSQGMVRVIIIGVVLIGLLYAYSDVLFGSLVEQTNSDVNKGNVRLLAATYFWGESTQSPQVFALGHGLPSGNGNFSILMSQLQEFMGFFTSDVGFIGIIYTYGAIYVLICYRILWKLFFTYKKVVPLYVRMFVIFAASMSIMIFPIRDQTTIFIWTMIIYISDLYINRGKRTQVLIKNK